jgi:hypothetical protein
MNVLGAGSEHEGEFGVWVEAGGARVEKNFADIFSGCRAPRFAGHDDVEPLLPESLVEFLELCAFAAAVKTFEGYEFSARHEENHSIGFPPFRKEREMVGQPLLRFNAVKLRKHP